MPGDGPPSPGETSWTPGSSSPSFAARDEAIPVVRIAAPAAEQLEAARSWWIGHRDKAPSAFIDDVTDLVARLELRPELVGRPVEQDPTVRRVYLRRIRYHVYFEIADDRSLVTILAIWHGSREGDPDL